ncbi:MAG TPA: iron-sulfur cluster assembly scaffold protein [Anaeromyxobacteraceae bacterium]|nr:iron-sulfur cluster assembly scaffold protein [Anaeromyxobacteraceae bacterium]
MSDDELYRDALMALAREGVGAGRLEGAASSATRDNPLCGDRVTFEVRLENHRVSALAHQVRGCALCQAAASYLARSAPGASLADLSEARGALLALLRGGAATARPWPGLEVFAPVGRVKSRHACVLLPFDALADAIAGAEG